MKSKTSTLGALLLVVGFALLAHAGYSTIQYRKYLRMIDQDYKGSPYDVHIECVVGCLLCLCGCVSCSDDLEPIRLAQTFHSKTADDLSFRPDFMTFNHRGRVLGLMMSAAAGASRSKTT